MIENRKARHDYAVLEDIECGIELTGTEVKVLRHGEGSLAGAYGAVLGGELYLVGMNIPAYGFGNRFNHQPVRNRRLLAHAKEIRALKMKTEAKGLTLPAKVAAPGYKRESLKAKAVRRELERIG